MLKVVIAQQLKHFWTEAGFGLYLLYITLLYRQPYLEIEIEKEKISEELEMEGLGIKISYIPQSCASSIWPPCSYRL